MAKTELAWTDINPAELPPPVRVKYDAYKAAYRAMKEAKLAFEESARGVIPAPDGFEVKFGYNFGKLGIALAPVSDKPKPAAKGATTLAQWIAAQQAMGR